MILDKGIMKFALAICVLLIAISMIAVPSFEKENSMEEIEHRIEKKEVNRKARGAYFHQLLRDPSTDQIPNNIRNRELSFLKSSALMQANSKAPDFIWREAGPNNIGGRTRALALDLRNSDIILAGGVSGGMWKSVDKGESWALTLGVEELLGVTALAQDPRPGHQDTWYYASGERLSRSAWDRGRTASILGRGFYKSVDNGDSWENIQVAGDPHDLDSPFDYVSKIEVHPQTGDIFLSGTNYGLMRSQNQGISFQNVLGDQGDHIWSEFDIAGDGSILASIASNETNPPTQEAGIYRSTNNGDSWTNVTPSDFPAVHKRTVIEFAPSNPEVAYIFSSNGDLGFGGSFFKLNPQSGVSENRTANLPPYEEPYYSEGVYLQGGYNMALAVKPDDENFVLLGATNAYRSRDGFASPTGYSPEHWIGGFGDGWDVCRSCYPNHHSDQHIFVFDPQDTQKLWNGTDGGVYYADDITSAEISWDPRNDGYNVTQFYTVAISRLSGDNRMVGGTQDNGSPYIRYRSQSIANGIDLTDADGGYAYIADQNIIASQQFGTLLKIPLVPFSGPDLSAIQNITPDAAFNTQFIHPFAVDPNDENTILYPVGTRFSRYDLQGDSWENLLDLNADGTSAITAMSFTDKAPSHRLYFGAFRTNETPKLFRVDQANTTTQGEVDISIPNLTEGSYIHDIAVNPRNGKELMVVISNYNVRGVFYSSNSGQDWDYVEGNLEGNQELPGPSIRSATILPLDDGSNYYFLGTSAGLFTTTFLNGENTRWGRQAEYPIGNAIISQVKSRPSDGRIAVATHGRGLFVGIPTFPVDNEETETPFSQRIVESVNFPNPFQRNTTIQFKAELLENVSLELFDIQGRLVKRVEYAPSPSTQNIHTIDLDLEELTSGSYFYQIAGPSRVGRISGSLQLR